MSACTKHAAEPVRGYSDCPGCEVESLRQQLAAAQAEARNWKRIAEDAIHVEREELTRAREIVSGMREYADSCDHPAEASKRNAVEYWLTQLEDALSPAPEPRSTHRVWRDGEWLPCYCLAGCDHGIGSEQPAKRDPAELVRLFNGNDWPRPAAQESGDASD